MPAPLPRYSGELDPRIREADDYVLQSCRAVLPDRIIEEASLVVLNGRIAKVLGPGAALPEGYESLEILDAGGRLVTPGLVEFHIHGAGGVGFDDLGENPVEGARALRKAWAFLLSRGVTAFLPTLVARWGKVGALAAAIEEAGLPESALPGIYIEGPFINPAKRGGIFEDSIRAPDLEILAFLLAEAGGRLRLMTLAPELPGASEVAAALARAGVLPSLGHSDCRLDRIDLPEAPFSITHLFNAMSGFSHREPGLAMLPFLDRRPWVELNADGIHVGDEALRVCSASLDEGRLILISDAVIAAGLPEGEYQYYGETVRSGPEGVRYASSGTLMGSNRLAPEVLRHWLSVSRCKVPTAVRALTLNPWRALGQGARRGALLPGYEASLVVWEGDFESAERVLVPAGSTGDAKQTP